LPSALWPQFDKAIGEAASALNAAQVSPWARLQSGQALHVQRFDGSTLAYPAGTRYTGAPQQAFWNGYIEPFLEDLAFAQLRAAAAAAKDTDADPGEVVADVAGLLNAACRKVYDRMADIDRRLLGDGYADAGSGRVTRGEMRAMEAYIRKQAASAAALAAIAAQKPPPLREYAWRNRVLVGLLVGLLVALVAAIALL
jgi:hypothetical protein